ncbi:MAG: hypothetical protein FWD61_19530 [Phycisphaerales bacterium]|nr:hypothetical protein [Phycisphaerales bacterium]
MSEIIEILDKFACEIENARGHEHLYGVFDEAIQTIHRHELNSAEKLKIDEVINILLWESDAYKEAIGHAPWSIRCLYCAWQFNLILNDQGYAQRIDELCHMHIERDIESFMSFSSDGFNLYIKNQKAKLNFDEILFIIQQCFWQSNCGGRPRDLSTERFLKYLVCTGHDLFEWYLSNSNDHACFPALHDKINTLHLGRIYENLLDCGSSSEHSEIAAVINESIERHLAFYQKWADRDINSFLTCLSEEFIHEVLTLCEDDVFFRFLAQISSVGNEKSKRILAHYENDDESHIRSFVRNLLRPKMAEGM